VVEWGRRCCFCLFRARILLSWGVVDVITLLGLKHIKVLVPRHGRARPRRSLDILAFKLYTLCLSLNQEKNPIRTQPQVNKPTPERRTRQHQLCPDYPNDPTSCFLRTHFYPTRPPTKSNPPIHPSQPTLPLLSAASHHRYPPPYVPTQAIHPYPPTYPFKPPTPQKQRKPPTTPPQPPTPNHPPPPFPPSSPPQQKSYAHHHHPH
jgi:hypothetical protein